MSLAGIWFVASSNLLHMKFMVHCFSKKQRTRHNSSSTATISFINTGSGGWATCVIKQVQSVTGTQKENHTHFSNQSSALLWFSNSRLYYIYVTGVQRFLLMHSCDQRGVNSVKKNKDAECHYKKLLGTEYKWREGEGEWERDVPTLVVDPGFSGGSSSSQ